MRTIIAASFVASLGLASSSVRAEDLQTYAVTLKGHRFSPTELHVPAGKAFVLVISNQDDTPVEFEMRSPPLERLIQPGAEAKVRVRPLSPDRFTFFDDFHLGSAPGAIIAE